jgi:hypothetical protein
MFHYQIYVKLLHKGYQKNFWFLVHLVLIFTFTSISSSKKKFIPIHLTVSTDIICISKTFAVASVTFIFRENLNLKSCKDGSQFLFGS